MLAMQPDGSASVQGAAVQGCSGRTGRTPPRWHCAGASEPLASCHLGCGCCSLGRDGCSRREAGDGLRQLGRLHALHRVHHLAVLQRAIRGSSGAVSSAPSMPAVRHARSPTFIIKNTGLQRPLYCCTSGLALESTYRQPARTRGPLVTVLQPRRVGRVTWSTAAATHRVELERTRDVVIKLLQDGGHRLAGPTPPLVHLGDCTRRGRCEMHPPRWKPGAAGGSPHHCSPWTNPCTPSSAVNAAESLMSV